MGWAIAALVVVLVVAAITAIEIRGKRKRASGRPRALEAGADPERDGKHPSSGAWMGWMGGSGSGS